MEKRIYRRYLKLPLFGAIYATIAIIGLGLYQAYQMQSLVESMQTQAGANQGNGYAFDGFLMTLFYSPFFFCGIFIFFFVINWITRLIFFSIYFMESRSNQLLDRTSQAQSGQE